MNWIWVVIAVLIILAFLIITYSFLVANNPYRDIDQEYEEQMKYLHEQYLKHKRKHQITVR